MNRFNELEDKGQLTLASEQILAASIKIIRKNGDEEIIVLKEPDGDSSD